MPDTIIIRRAPDGYMAQFNDPAVLAAFGTDTIPTAFTASASPATVLAAIRALNPRSTVVLHASLQS